MLLFMLEVHKDDILCSARDNYALVCSLVVDNLFNPSNTQKVSKKAKLKQNYYEQTVIKGLFL